MRAADSAILAGQWRYCCYVSAYAAMLAMFDAFEHNAISQVYNDDS